MNSRSNSVESLLDGLTSSDPGVRVSACETLATETDRMAHRDRVRALLEMLVDEDAGVRRAALDALIKLGEARLARGVRGALAGRRDARRLLRELVRAGDYRCADLLVFLLEHGPPALQKASRRTLRAIHPETRKHPYLFYCRKHWIQPEERRTQGAALGAGEVRWLACGACDACADLVGGVKKVIGVLDKNMDKLYTAEKGVVHVNLLSLDGLADVDEVTVRDASDEDVERLCLLMRDRHATHRGRLGGRQSLEARYGCALRPETVNMLTHTFKRVKKL